MKRIETSKIVLGCTLLFCAVFAVAVLAGWYYGLDGAPEMLAIPASIAGTVIGFYSWKAKNENLIKLGGEKVNKSVMKTILKMEDNENG